MKESHNTDEIMLCFVQGYRNGEHNECRKSEGARLDLQNRSKPLSKSKSNVEQLLVQEEIKDVVEVELRPKKKRSLVSGKSLKLVSGERLKSLPDGKWPEKRNSAFRKTWSTGNFASGGVGAGGCGAPRSAPATPLQLDPPPRTSKHDKQIVKPLSSSVPSVRAAGLPGATGSGGSALSDASESKAPSKARQKKFFRHFPQVPPDERVLNYYSCALVGDILLQGHLYITKNYFAFYSNVFGYVTKLLIPTSSVLRVTKEKMARIIPNAVGVCTRDERHVFGSLMSRDSTHKLMTHVWKAARAPELATPPPSQDLRISEAELDASEYSPEDESSSGAGEDVIDNGHVNRRESEAIIAGSGTAIIQPALLTGGKSSLTSQKSDTFVNKVVMVAIVVFTITAIFLGYKICAVPHQEPLDSLSGDELYSELMRWQARLHGRAASELQAFLSTNLMLLTKVRQSLEALSGVILTDISHGGVGNLDVPNDTTFS